MIEDFFPRNGVRYIAMNDGIDTLRDNNDIAPFKNILNEMYSKDISKKYGKTNTKEYLAKKKDISYNEDEVQKSQIPVSYTHLRT